MNKTHKPVMTDEILAALNLKTGGVYVDCTIGTGGHALSMLETVPNIRILGIDVDEEARQIASQRLNKFGDSVRIVNGNFANVWSITNQQGFFPADGIMFDLGLSSLQVDTPDRGFSFRQEAKLDMRFDPSSATDTAHDLVNHHTERSLTDIIRKFGEEPKASQIARAITRSRPVESTTDLANLIMEFTSGKYRKSKIHPATRTFQALRMAVNSELINLKRGLEQAIKALNLAGRLAVISYHSLEDRLVKNKLRQESSNCMCPPKSPVCICDHSATLRLVHKRVIKPTTEEVESNPRSRSAKLRTAERC